MPDPSRFKCQWIDGEPSLDDGCKCSLPVKKLDGGGSSSYCEEHHAKAWNPAPKGGALWPRQTRNPGTFKLPKLRSMFDV